MDNQEIKHILEALLMSSNEPLSIEQLYMAFEEWEKPKRIEIQNLLKELMSDYESHAIELKECAGSYCFQTRAKYSSWISRLYAEKPAKYSRALLETLAIIAYRQPTTRAEIEDIRGVSLSSSILKTLLERNWVTVAGYRDVPGKPAVYKTTKEFLDYFNLESINELPDLQNKIEITNE